MRGDVLENIIDIKNINFRYDKSPVLDGISLGIKPGSFVSIIGPNGSGKTTLLKSISGILSPEDGSVLIRGKDLRKYKKRELARFMAFVPQNTALDFAFSVMDVVLMGRAPFKKAFESETMEDIRIAERVMDMTNLLGLREKKITEISGGERQRTILACALAQTPEIMFLDEPVSSLDIQHQIEVMSILKRLNIKSGMTIVMVLHDLNLAAEYSDVVVLMKDGKLLYNGTPKDVITASNIEGVYNTSIYMTTNPISGNPHIIPVFKT